MLDQGGRCGFVALIGAPNAGKSTIAAGIACAYPNSIFIDGDFVLSEEQEATLKDMPQEKFSPLTYMSLLPPSTR